MQSTTTTATATAAMTGLCQMLENPNRKKGIASDDRTVGTMDSLSKKDLAMITRPASRRGGKKNGNGSSSSSMNLSQVLESMNDSGSSFGSSYNKDNEPDNQTMDGTVDSCILRGASSPRLSKRGGRRRPSQKDTTKDGEEAVKDRAQHKRTISLEDL